MDDTATFRDTTFGNTNATATTMATDGMKGTVMVTRHRHHRKRSRNRPAARARQLQVAQAMPHVSGPSSCEWSGMSAATSLGSVTRRSEGRTIWLERESEASRERRIFGGLDDDTQSARDLKGPMLDVVLGLFNGIDYDDAMC